MLEASLLPAALEVGSSGLVSSAAGSGLMSCTCSIHAPSRSFQTKRFCPVQRCLAYHKVEKVHLDQQERKQAWGERMG